ncbi:MAG: winged helix-turn-helix transcriptional regulator [Longimicrobiales bacterium]
MSRRDLTRTVERDSGLTPRELARRSGLSESALLSWV